MWIVACQPLWSALRQRGRTYCIVTSDHGTTYGEDGYTGHRLAHPVVWKRTLCTVLVESKDIEEKTMTSTDVQRTAPPFSLRPYTAYTYAYPHKTAYRPLEVVRKLEDVWSAEDLSRLFLYIHIPFCEVRCGFCNLFTVARASGELSTEYLTALRRQMRAVKRALPEARFARLAIGGGTPTYLHQDELAQLFSMLRDELASTHARYLAHAKLTCDHRSR